MQRKSKNRPLAIESLEDRSLMAGNITASVVNGSLIVTGDDEANGFLIAQAGENTFRISSAGALPTTINGKTSTDRGFSFSGVTNDIEITVNGGADYVQVGASTQIRVPRNLVVDGGEAADTVYIDGRVGASGRGGYFIVQSANVHSAGLDVPKNFVAKGINWFSGGGVTGVDGNIVFTGTAGADRYELDAITAGNVKVNTLGGPDFVSLTHRPRITGDVNIATGDGDDQVRIGSLSVNNLNINLEKGADQLLAWGQSTIRQEARVFGGEGSDKVLLEGFNAQDAFYVWLYTENDRLEIKSTSSPRAVLGGGPGTDALILGVDNSIGQIDQTGFE